MTSTALGRLFSFLLNAGMDCNNLFTEVRIERTENNYYFVKNGEVEGNGQTAVAGAIFHLINTTLAPIPSAWGETAFWAYITRRER